MNRIAVYVITVKGTRNYEKLIEDVVQNLRVTPIVTWGITPYELPCADTNEHLHEGRHRNLSCIEVAAALSHTRARALALLEGVEWCIFLEDDSELIRHDNSDFVSDLLSLPNNVPFFVHLFPEQNGILTRCRFNGMNSLKKIPDYTNAYILNNKALRYLLMDAKDSHSYLADWPKFPQQIKKIAPERSIFRHSIQNLNSSLIAEDRLKIQRNPQAFKMKYKCKQFAFKILRFIFPKYGNEVIATESLRSVKWW
jgi:hypothetical protein